MALLSGLIEEGMLALQSANANRSPQHRPVGPG